MTGRPWRGVEPPARILAIRLQAIGDVVITLAYLNGLRRLHPDASIDFLTREEAEAIPKRAALFRRVFTIGGGRNFKLQSLSAMALFPKLLVRRYQLVLDLQNNEISRTLTRALRPAAFCRFDKTSGLPAGERTRRAIESAGLGPIRLTPLRLRPDLETSMLLERAGRRAGHGLVVLNPAGNFPSRNWRLENYARFADAWRRLAGAPTQFLALGLPSLAPKIRKLSELMGGSLLSLVGETSADQAFALLQEAELVLTEDSGLMHMAWVAGVPTLALFGSSRGDWSRPLGPRSLCLDSGDLPCGFCMEAECRFGDVPCLSRHSPELVARKALALARSGPDGLR